MDIFDVILGTLAKRADDLLTSGGRRIARFIITLIGFTLTIYLTGLINLGGSDGMALFLGVILYLVLHITLMRKLFKKLHILNLREMQEIKRKKMGDDWEYIARKHKAERERLKSIEEGQREFEKRKQLQMRIREKNKEENGV